MLKCVKSFSLLLNFIVAHSSASILRKCCPPHEILQLSTPSLVLTTYSDEYNCVPLSIVDNIRTSGSAINSALKYAKDIEAGEKICKGSWSILHNSADKWFKLREDTVHVGLNFWQWPVWLSVDQNSSCVDSVSLTGDLPEYMEDHAIADALIFCGEPHRFAAYLTHRTLYGILFMISSIFVLLTLVIYAFLWSDQNTHGCTQISFFIAVLFFYILEGLRDLIKLNGFYIFPSKKCFIHAVFAHYFYVCVNTTSAVMGFDLLLVFCHLDPSAYKVKNWKRICIYCIISWLLPFLGILAGLLLHHFISPEEATRNENGLFEFAHYRCSSPLWHASFYIQALLVLLNIVLFGVTSALICKHRNSTVAGTTSRKTQKYLSESISIFSKLFFVLGMTWIAIIIEFFVGEEDPVSYSWLILRVVNLLLGVVYFLLFGINRKNLSSLRKKYQIMDRAITALRLKNFTEESQIASSSKNVVSTE